MSAPERALVVGDVFIDLVSRIDVMPVAGSGTWGTPLVAHGGGCGGNMAACLARLGVPTRFLTPVGDDEYGRLAIRQLEEAGVDARDIVVDPQSSSGAVIILVDRDNERTIIPCALGAAYEKLRSEHVDRALADPVEHILLTGVALGADPTGLSLLHLARTRPAGSTLYFDPNLRQPPETVGDELRARFQEASERADVVLVGAAEADALGLRRREGQVFITKNGAHGCRVVDAEGREWPVPALPVDLVDSTGAGDAFAAGLIASRARGNGLEAAVRHATAAGALAVRALGARVPMTWDDIQQIEGDR